MCLSEDICALCCVSVYALILKDLRLVLCPCVCLKRSPPCVVSMCLSEEISALCCVHVSLKISTPCVVSMCLSEEISALCCVHVSV